MSYKKIILNIFLVITTTTYAQNKELKLPFYPPLETKLVEAKVTVDILPDDEYRPNFEVFINGEGPFLFGIDWGLNAFVISSELSEKLGLQKAGTYEMPGRAEDYVEIKEMKIGDASFNGATAFAKEILDKRIQGVMGFNVFEQVLMTFDFPNKKLIFEKGELPQPDNKNIFSLATPEEGERPDIDVSIGDLKFKATLDTRAFGWLIINDEYMDDLTTYGPKDEFIGQGPQMGTMNITATRVEETLMVGWMEVRNPIVKFRNRPGAIIGMDFMKNFTITLDKQNHRVKFETTKSMPLLPEEEFWEKEQSEISDEYIPEKPERYAGRYGIRNVYYENGQLFLQRDSESVSTTDSNGRRVKMVTPKLQLTYEGNNEFSIPRIPGAKVKFVENNNGEITELHVLNRGGDWEKSKKEN